MKTFLLILSIITISFSQLDYTDFPGDGGGDFLTSNCLSIANALRSPISIESSICQSYQSFEITMTDINQAPGGSVDDTRGSYFVPYTGATIVYNGQTYTSDRITFRSRSEHQLRGGYVDLEMQIEMTPSAVLSFFIREVDAADTQYTSTNNYNIVREIDGTTWNIELARLARQINSRPDNNIMLNMYTYSGTKTYPSCDATTWFIYGSELYATSTVIDGYRTLVTGGANTYGTSAPLTDTGRADDLNRRPFSGEGGGDGTRTVTRLCFTGYFKNTLGDNYGLWFGIGTILLFFVFTLVLGDKPIKQVDYVENVWTHHPFYSVIAVGNEIHTRKSRAALILITATVIGLFASVFYRDAKDKKKGSNTIVFAIYAVLINWLIVYGIGNILRAYYIAKYQFLKTKEEAWDQRAQNRLFAFYFSIFLIIAIGWSFIVYNLNETIVLINDKDEGPQPLWVASFFIGLGLEYLIFYPLVCLLATRSNFIRGLARRAGFMYDNICHETYLDYVKLE